MATKLKQPRNMIKLVNSSSYWDEIGTLVINPEGVVYRRTETGWMSVPRSEWDKAVSAGDR